MRTRDEEIMRKEIVKSKEAAVGEQAAELKRVFQRWLLEMTHWGTDT